MDDGWDDVDGWLDSLLDDLLWELELEEAQGWVNGLAQFRDAEIIPENSAEKQKGPAMPAPDASNV